MDLNFSVWVAQHLHTPVLDAVMLFVTGLGDYGFIWVLLSFLLLAYRPTRRAGMAALASLLLVTLLGNGVLKNLFARPRPFTHLSDFTLLLAAPHGFSFPSGHAGSSFAAATSIYLYHHKYGRWALLLAALIALSRVYLTVHYLTDVIAGALLGVLAALFVRWLFPRIRL